MWKEIGGACGWMHLRVPSVRNMSGDERATEAALTFLRDTKAGRTVAIAPPLEEAGCPFLLLL